MKTSSFLAQSITLLALLSAPFALAVEPPPRGGYPNDNTALGDDALFSANLSDSNTRDNTAIGFQALYSMTTAEDNTAVGSQSLLKLTTGLLNTAVGGSALASLSTAYNNTAVGYQALTASTTGLANTAVGSGALSRNTTASANTAVGVFALLENTTGEGNTALGTQALLNNSSGASNTAVGHYSMENVGGNKNTAIGANAMYQAHGNRNIAVGNFAGQNFDGDNNIEIGNVGTKHDSNTIRIGDKKTQTRTFIAGINGITVPDGVAVLVNSQGQLGVATSSARYKEKIQPMDKASEALLSLQPVTFQYKKELDSIGTPQFGLVAEQVAKVAPALVARDESGKPYTVRYEAVNAMLLNEFLKEHRKVESLEETVSELKTVLKEQAAQIQKIGAQVQVAQVPAPRVVTSE